MAPPCQPHGRAGGVGPALELAETFGRPSRCRGTVHQAAHGLEVGRCPDQARQAKTLLLEPLRRDARERLRSERERKGRTAEKRPPRWGTADLQSGRELPEEVPDPRRGPALRQPPGAVPSLPTLTKNCGWRSGRRTEAFAEAWPPEDCRRWAA